MPTVSKYAVKLLAASVFALAAAAAPAAAVLYAPPTAHAEGHGGEGGVPAPEPVPQPKSSVASGGGAAACAAGESLGADGNCVPTMSPVPATAPGAAPVAASPDPQEDLQPRTTQDVTTTTNTGLGANMVPNINGYPCTGYWESMACYESSQSEVAVQPKSTLSSSP